MDVFDAIHTRRSTRAFTPEPVSAETIEKVLRAAMAAPSASNERPWRFVVVRDRETLDRLAGATRWSAPMGRAPVGIVVFADTSARKVDVDLWMVDCALAAQNLMLAARAEGLGTVWLAAWPYPEFVANISAILGAPEGVVPVVMLAVGMPEKPAESVDRFEPEWVFSERYAQR